MKLPTYIFSYIWIFTLVFFCTGSEILYSATYYFDPVGNTVGLKETNEVTILINTNGEQINAFKGTIVFPKQVVEVVDIQTDDTVIDFWVEEPVVEDDRITFAGIVPQGFGGVLTAYGNERKSGVLMRITYRGIAVGSESFEFANAEAYLNDGNASPVEVDIVPAAVDVVKVTAHSDTYENQDIVQPESFVPFITQNTALADGSYVVVFKTVDRGSGIDHYEVSEVHGQNVSLQPQSNWVVATSPHVLADQSGAGTVFVKAVDRAGNERIERALVDSKVASSHEEKDSAFSWWLVTALLMIVSVAFVYIRRYSR